jgi:hypothetical protein
MPFSHHKLSPDSRDPSDQKFLFEEQEDARLQEGGLASVIDLDGWWNRARTWWHSCHKGTTTTLTALEISMAAIAALAQLDYYSWVHWHLSRSCHHRRFALLSLLEPPAAMSVGVWPSGPVCSLRYAPRDVQGTCAQRRSLAPPSCHKEEDDDICTSPRCTANGEKVEGAAGHGDLVALLLSLFSLF